MSTHFLGTLHGHREGHGIFRSDQLPSDVYITKAHLKGAIHGDRVKVKLLSKNKSKKIEGKVIEVLSHSSQVIVGQFKLLSKKQYGVIPEDPRYGQPILIAPKHQADAQEGQIVVVELTSLSDQPLQGKIKEVLGQVGDPGLEIEIAVRQFGLSHIFSDETQKQVAKLPSTVQASDKKARVDLTDLAFVTIDGEDARDFDDAVYAEPMPKKQWRLLVAIADVGHYVQKGGAIDQDAFLRATSVYFPRRVIPMLPEKLSNGLCSLKPLEERLALVADMVIDAKGEIQAYQFYEAVIKSQARLTYTQVAQMLDLSETLTQKTQNQFVFLKVPLQHLYQVYQSLLQARKKRGALDLETTETKIISDEQGRILRIEPLVRNDAHRLIEEAMLAANVCAADFLIQSNQKGLYRVHGKPPEDRVLILKKYLQAIGISIAGLSQEPTALQYQALSQQSRDRPDVKAIHTMLLRSMPQAVYSAEVQPHFGLSYDAYTHFTSPIRRYPDLMVHRVIKSILHKKSFSLSKENEDLAWREIATHCSERERRADEASRDVTLWLKCQYMQNALGDVFMGHVTGVTSFGIFVTLEAIYIEGMVHISDLGSDYFIFDPTRHELRGERSGRHYGLGMPVRIQVSRVDTPSRRIDFHLLPL